MPAIASITVAVQSAPAPPGAVGEDASWINAWSALNGGNNLGRQAISTDPDALALGDRYELDADALVLTQPEGPGETNHMSERKIRGAVLGGIWISWHTDDPGPDGADNLVTGIARTPISAANFTFARS